MRNSLTALILLGTAALACATRSVPEQESPKSPASLAEAAAPPAVVTTALDGDPPLPGEPEGAWRGLREEPAEAGGEDHSAHSGHEHQAAPNSAGHDHHASKPPDATSPAPDEKESSESAAPDESAAPEAPTGHEHHHHHHHEAPDATP